MSAGKFTNSKYEADNGDIYGIRVMPATLLANVGSVNAAPAGAVDQQSSARVGGGRREFGVKARYASIKFTETVPDGYAADQILRIPILTPAVFNAIAKNQVGTYRGVAIQVIGKTGESVK